MKSWVTRAYVDESLLSLTRDSFLDEEVQEEREDGLDAYLAFGELLGRDAQEARDVFAHGFDEAFRVCEDVAGVGVDGLDVGDVLEELLADIVHGLDEETDGRGEALLIDHEVALLSVHDGELALFVGAEQVVLVVHADLARHDARDVER